jgi:hypothetical protein
LFFGISLFIAWLYFIHIPFLLCLCLVWCTEADHGEGTLSFFVNEKKVPYAIYGLHIPAHLGMCVDIGKCVYVGVCIRECWMCLCAAMDRMCV